MAELEIELGIFGAQFGYGLNVESINLIGIQVSFGLD